MTKLFISYRREDSEYVTDRLDELLVQHYGRANVFRDVDSIPFGEDFPAYLDRMVSQCAILIAVIGSRWLDVEDSGGLRRLDNANDFVRLEIETALKRDILVIPVTIEGATIPRADQLPDSMAKLSSRNGIELGPASRFKSDVENLIRNMDRSIRLAAEERQRKERAAAEQERQRLKQEAAERRKATRPVWHWAVPAATVGGTCIVVLALYLGSGIISRSPSDNPTSRPASESPSSVPITLSASVLAAQYEVDPAATNNKYQARRLTVVGTVIKKLEPTGSEDMTLVLQGSERTRIECSITLPADDGIKDLDTQIANLRAAVSTVKSKKASLEKAKADLQRGEKLVSSASISKEELDIYRQAVKKAETSVGEALDNVYALRKKLGLPEQPAEGKDLDDMPPDWGKSTREKFIQNVAQVGDHIDVTGFYSGGINERVRLVGCSVERQQK